MLATERLSPDDKKILAKARRDNVAAARPGQLEERKQHVATLAPPDAAEMKQRTEAAEELRRAERDVEAARAALDRAMNRVSDLGRTSHGRSHGASIRDADAHAALRRSAHPAIPAVVNALIRADHVACAVGPSIIGHEIAAAETTISSEASRRWWFQPPSVEETIRPVTSHATQVTFLEAIRAARINAENLSYQDLSDDATITKLRAELDAVLHASLPTNLHHARDPLAMLRQKLNRDALTLWTIGEEVIE